MVRKWPLLIAVAVVIASAGFLIGSMHKQNYSGGYITAKAVDEAPSGVTPANISDSDMSDSKLLTATVRQAVTNGSARSSITSQKQYDTVLAALPDSAYYQGENGDAGWYVQYHGTIVRVNTAKIV